MKVERIDVLIFYVKDLEQSVKFFSELMGTKFIGPLVKDYPDYEGVEKKDAFSKAIGNISLELVQPINPNCSIAKWIDEHGEGLSSIGLKVVDRDEAVAELQAKGFTLKSKTKGIPVVLSLGGKRLQGEQNVKVATLTAPGNAYRGLQFMLLEYKDAPGFAMATLRKLGDLPWIDE